MSVEQYIDALLDLAIKEDVGDGDWTSLSTIPHHQIGKMQLLVKEDGIIGGVEMASKIFHRIDKNTVIDVKIKDGNAVKKGDIVFYVSGNLIALLQSERLVLNVMQHLSGIATVTAKYVKLLEGTKTKLLDTRKTTPGMRVLEKMAVVWGGGVNHRMGLFDMILIKDNHVDFAGGVIEAIENVTSYLNKHNKVLDIEVEVRTIDDLEKVMNYCQEHKQHKIVRIMLDNFSIENTKKAVDLVKNRIPLESSGNITQTTIRDYARCGVDYISVGALTHSIQSLDLSLKAVK